MIYQILKLILYISSVLLAMYGLTCFSFDGVLKKEKTKEFYVFYFMSSLALGYLVSSFILDFMTIHF